jgi:hypothetical protein
MKKLLLISLVIAVCAIVFPHLFVRAQEQDTAARQQQDLAKFFRNHDRLKLSTADVAEQVRNHRPVSIYTPSAAFDIELTAHDMRGRNYRAVEMGADGVERAVKMGLARTYKGSVLGRDDAQARFTVDDRTFEGLIVTPEERYMVEPMRKYSATAEATDFVLYRASDVIKGQEGAGEEPIDYELRHTVEDVAPRVNDAMLAPEAVTATVRDIELSTEADYEYVVGLGGTSQAANNEIMSIMNMVEGVYQTQLDLTFTIVFQHTWIANNDPYATTEPGGCYNNVVCGPNPSQIVPRGILNEFMEYWNTNYPAGGGANNPKRDLAHIWTGKDVNGSVIGLAWLNVVCSAPTYSYGFSQRIATAPVKYAVTAHEIGHNLSASHSDGQTGCTNTIMSSISSPNSVLEFCPFSVNQIKTYVNANSGCLTTVNTTCTYTISPTSKSFTSTGGSDQVTVTTTAGCAWTAVSNAAWVTITAGASGTGNGAVSYTVAANTASTSRTGTLTVAGKTFTVTQTGVAAVPALSALRLNRSNVPGCLSLTGTVILTAPAPVNGVIVTLSDNIAATRVPVSVTVPAGLTSKAFTITTVPVTVNQVGSVTATLGAVSKSAALTVRRIGVLSVSLTPNPVVGPNPVTGTVVLECVAPAGGIVVALASTSPAVAAPTVSSLSILAGARSKTFSVRTANVTVSSSAIIKGTANAITKTKTLTVN